MIQTLKTSVLKLIPDSIYLSFQYYRHFHKILNLKRPRTFNEKLQWLKIHNRKGIYSAMVDKQLAKEYVAAIIGKEYIIPTIDFWVQPNQIQIDSLPPKFVLKSNHDSGGVIVCKDKNGLNLPLVKEFFKNHLKNNVFWVTREWPYKNVKPCIIAEQYIGNENEDLNDYKFFCFNGEVKLFKIDFDRFHKHQANYYSPQGEILPFGEKVCPPNFEKHNKLPESLPEMIRLAEKLSKEQPFLRVDFYNIQEKIYFGELTFFPNSGFGPFTDDTWDDIMGSWIDINELK